MQPIDAQRIRWQVCDATADETLHFDRDPTQPERVSLLRLSINSIATFVVVVTFGLAILATVPWLLGYRSVVVASGSMEPAVHVGDVVLTTASDGRDLGVGTVINHHVSETMRLHRIVGIVEAGYRTAGDANRSDDSDVVAPDQIEGVGIMLVPFVGLPRIWLDHHQYFHLMVSIVVMALALRASRRTWLQPSHAWSAR